MDSNPRHFFIDVTNAEANVDADAKQDFVTIEFAGTITPTVKARLEKALKSGEFALVNKKLLG